jgi:hypothetical protein
MLTLKHKVNAEQNVQQKPSDVDVEETSQFKSMNEIDLRKI